MEFETKICKKCGRELPNNKDYYFVKLGKLKNSCKECDGHKFTNHLTHIAKDGYCFCKKCDRELPYEYRYFPEDKATKTGLRNMCRECNPSYGRFLNKDEDYHDRKWTDGEIKLLKEVYKDYTNKELVEKFFPTRTIRSIESMASILKVSGKTEETYKRSRAYQTEIIRDKLTGRIITSEWREKISKTKKEYYKTHDGWWKGRKRSKEQCQFMSELRKSEGKWKGDLNPRHINPLKGKDNGRWEGGITDTYTELRSDTKDWQNESMEFCNYRCVVTDNDFDNIHHTTPFKDIVNYSFKNIGLEVKEKVSDYNHNDFERLRLELKALHVCFGYGACLSKEVHKLFHDNYGYTNFTPYDFLDFIYRIDYGEFNEWFSENKLDININYNYIEYLENTLLNLEEAV